MNCASSRWFCVFFFNDTATTEIYTLSLHDALPILKQLLGFDAVHGWPRLLNRKRSFPLDPFARRRVGGDFPVRDRKSTRLNSSHANISYAVFCLKKKT